MLYSQRSSIYNSVGEKMASKKFQYNKSATSRDVAKLAGVSQSTVSRVFATTDGKGVTAQAREKVLKAAEELGYRPNFVARGMISGKTNIIGVVVGEGMGPFYHNIMDRLISSIQAMGKQSLMFKVSKRDNIYNIILKVIQFQVEAIIITAPAMAKEVQDLGVESDIPVILFNRFIPDAQFHTAYINAIEGGNLAAECLCNSGHTDIAYIRYTQDTGEETEKQIGFSAGLRRHGIYQMQIEKAEYTYESGYEAFRRIYQSEKRPTAVFCTSDTIALGVMDAARKEFHLRVPEDISIIGYDDIPMVQWESYDMTTIRQPYGEMVDETLAIIQSLQSKEAEEIEQPIIKMIQPVLIERSTVKQRN